MVGDHRLDLVDRRAVGHDPAAPDQIAPIGVAEREEGGAPRSTVGVRQRFAQLLGRRAGVDDALRFGHERGDEIVPIRIVCQQRGQRAVRGDGSDGDEVKARVRQRY